MKNTAWNALVTCKGAIAEAVTKGVGLPEAKSEIGRMLKTQPSGARQFLSLQRLDRFLNALPAATMRGRALAYEISRDIDRRAKILRRRDLRAAS